MKYFITRIDGGSTTVPTLFFETILLLSFDSAYRDPFITSPLVETLPGSHL